MRANAPKRSDTFAIFSFLSLCFSPCPRGFFFSFFGRRNSAMKVHTYDSVPEIKEIAPGLFHTSIPQPFYAPNNIYVIVTDEPAVIDTGYIQNLGLLQQALKKIGLSLKKLRHIIYTHDHIDHISAAMTLRQYTDAKMYGMAGMAAAVGNFTDSILIYQRGMNRLVYKAHRDAESRRIELVKSEKGWGAFLKSVKQGAKVNPIIHIDVELVEGDVIEIGGKEIGFIHTPGHNRWHMTPYILGEGIYFTGDLVLENISSVYADIDGDLSLYRKSLERLSRLPIKRLLPSHGREPESPQRAIKLLLKTLAILERGVARRLKEKDHDLSELVLASMGEKVKGSDYYNTALAIIHSMIMKLVSQGQAEILEIDPPYERYRWTGPAPDISDAGQKDEQTVKSQIVPEKNRRKKTKPHTEPGITQRRGDARKKVKKQLKNKNKT